MFSKKDGEEEEGKRREIKGKGRGRGGGRRKEKHEGRRKDGKKIVKCFVELLSGEAINLALKSEDSIYFFSYEEPFHLQK